MALCRLGDVVVLQFPIIKCSPDALKHRLQ